MRQCTPNSFGNNAGAIVRNDEKLERFSRFWMACPRDSALVNTGDGGNSSFNFPKADSDAANLYEFASPSFDPQVSVVITAGEVARDDDGYLWVKGRTSEFIKIRGVRVSFGEVETKVAAVPGVYECAATATQHPEAGEALALFIVSDDGASTVAARVRRALPPQWTCVSVRVVPQLPKTENGKIARSQLRTMA